jgi:hypothetical protein
MVPTLPTSYSHTAVAHRSGDNAPGLIYKNAQGAFVGSGNNLNVIGPWLDGGTLNSQFKGSNWSVLNDILVSGNVATSKITLGGLDMAITTTVALSGQPNEVTEQLHRHHRQ